MRSVTTVLVLALAASALGGCDRAARTASASGEQESKLALAKPSPVTILRGGLAAVALRITRKDVPGDLTIRFDDLPSGVSVVGTDDRMEGNEATFDLRAADGAKLVVNHVSRVTATSENGLAATQQFEVTVADIDTSRGR